jgi:hypothetical protein
MDLIDGDAVSWVAFVNTAMNFQVCFMAGELLSRCRPLASQVKVCCMELDGYVKEKIFQAKQWFTLV